MNRAYSVLHVKAFDASGRHFSGIATTPTPDRIGDVIEPLGITFNNPLSLMLFHDNTQPVGTVRFGKPTKDGVPFEASIPEVTEPGAVKDLTDKAAHFVKYGLIRAVSIGFRIVNDAIEVLKTGGWRFLQTEVVELSLVPIPANTEAIITNIKSLDAPFLAASGESASVSVRSSAGVSAPVVRALTRANSMPKTIQDQIKDFQGTRAAKSARMTEIMQKAADEGATLDEAQSQEYDGIGVEIKAIDAHLVRLDALELENKAAARVVAATTAAEGAEARGPHAVVTVKETLPPGYEFARMVQCKLMSFLEFQKGNVISALDVAKQRFPDAHRIHKYIQTKAAVAAGTTTDSVWAAPLLADAQNLESEFLEYLRPQTIVGKFGTNGIPSLRRVPFNVKIGSQTTGGSASWVGQGKAKPLTKFEYADATLLFTKIAAIAVITEELARFSRPGAEGLVRDALSDAVIERMDRDFINPDIAAVSGVRPASITNGVTAGSSAGTSAANVLTDIQNLLEAFTLNNYNPADVVLIMPNTLALVLSLTENSLGQPAFAGVTMNGGTLRGLPVITSQYAASAGANGNMVIAVNARDIALADDGSVTVDVSREASLEMSDAPAGDSTAGTGASLVSMWQTNSVALRAERTVNWAKLRSGAVVFIDDVNWGSIGSPA